MELDSFDYNGAVAPSWQQVGSRLPENSANKIRRFGEFEKSYVPFKPWTLGMIGLRHYRRCQWYPHLTEGRERGSLPRREKSDSSTLHGTNLYCNDSRASHRRSSSSLIVWQTFLNIQDLYLKVVLA